MPWNTVSSVLAIAIAIAPAVKSSAAGPPSTEPEVSILVLPAQPVVGLSEQWSAALGERLTAGLERAGLPTHEAPADESCAAPTCLQAIASQTNATHLVRLAIAVEQSDYEVTIEVFSAKTGLRTITATDHCQVCGFAEVAEMVADQASAVRTKLLARPAAPPRLNIEAYPATAVISVDGVVFGTGTVTQQEVVPGTHLVKAENQGYADLQREVTAVAGTEESLVLRLQRIPVYKRARPWAWAALGAGVTSVSAGTVLLALDSRPYRRQCSGADVDAQGRCRLLYDTKAAGIGLVAAGAGLVVTFAILLATSRRAKRRGR